MTEINIKKDFEIEPDALDIEWLKQPRLRLKYADLSAETRKKSRDLKQRVKQVKAEISKEVRARGGKITDSLLDMEVELDLRYQQAVTELSQAMYEDDVISGRLQAVDDKKYSLQDLVKQWIGNYFAGPKEPRDLKKEFKPSDITEERVRKELLENGRK